MPEPVLDLVVRYRKGQTYGVHALIAALEVEPPPVPFTLHLARSVDEVVALVADGVAAGRRVLTVWSFYSPDAAGLAEELAQIRAAGPPSDGVVHLAGGVHATAEPLVTLRAGWDAVAIGEGERTFTTFVAAVATGQDWRGLPGTAYLDGAGAMVKAPGAQRRELDHYPPFPCSRNLTSPIEITRGCIYACRFCQTPFMFSARFRHRSVDSVREAIRVMRSRALRDVRFITPTSLSYGSPDGDVRLDAVEELLAACREEIGPNGRVFFGSFPSELRPEHVSVEALRLVKRYAANRDVIIGAQSGSDEVLELSGRGHGAQVVERAVRLCVQEGLRPNVDVMFGMPGEGEPQAAATVAMMGRLTDLGARIHAHTFMPLPGTPWRNEPAGRITEPTRRALATLTTRGGVYGSWEKQEQISAELASGRSPQAGHKSGRPRALRTRESSDS